MPDAVSVYPFLLIQDQAFQHRCLGYSVMACQAFEAALCLQADNHLESLAFAFFDSPLPVAGLLLCVGHRHVAPLDWLRCKQMMAHPGSYCVTTQPSVRESIAWTHIKKSGGHFLFSRPACVGGEGIPTFSSGRGWVHEAAQISAQKM